MPHFDINCIKKVLLTGLGGVGTVYANLINKNKNIEFKVLADKTRLEKYKKEPRLLNCEPCEFEFITPEDEFKPDLVFMDITMPEMDGIEALKKIIAHDKNAAVIMCAAIGQSPLAVETMKNGAKDVIFKPYNIEIVKEIVNKTFEKSK